ncbi:hypothetical protein M2322_000308 [Rhodoblastus acidophilus]|uniref:hypothetical protein n=1 Tax=Rhodoblastus acidophilus TaxID=1074 RepID=UPI002224AF55|nr:hypothetical protein [Rhodoblastus acidophilus]MCW2314788.1 hypothetical protein [Rhodoblastus acidophilus]
MIDRDVFDQQICDDETRKQDALNLWRRDTPGLEKRSMIGVVFDSVILGAAAFGFFGAIGGFGLAIHESYSAQTPGTGWLIILGPIYAVWTGGIAAIIGAILFPIFRYVFGSIRSNG